MAIYFNASAPKGWGVDETGHFIQIPAGYTQQGNQFVAPSTSVGGASNSEAVKAAGAAGANTSGLTLQQLWTIDPSLEPSIGTQNAPSPSSGLIGSSGYLKMPNGQVISVSSMDRNDYAAYIKGGAVPMSSGDVSQPANAPNAQTGQSATGAGGAAPDINASRQKLQSLGIDVSGLNDQQIQTLGMMNQVITANSTNDKQIAPQSLSQADLDSWFNQAKSQIDPYYQDQFNIYKQDLLNQAGMITGEVADQTKAQEQQFQAQKDQLTSQMAETGLAQSGIRQKAEQQLQDQQQGVVSSNRRQLQQQMYQLGSQAERAYGAQGASLLQPITSPGSAVAGVSATSVGYNPAGVKYPTMPQQETTDIINRQTQLGQQSLAQQNFQKTGTYTAT